MSGTRRGGRPTMVDVARDARVAVSTVSRVVNGDATVGAELAGRVSVAIAHLGWEVDDRARHLRRGVSGTIGAAVDELDSPFLREAERAARAAGLLVLATPTQNDQQLEREAVRSLVRRRVDGLILERRTGEADDYLREQIAHGLPVVAIDQPMTGAVSDSVVSDNSGGIELAYRHLVGRGHEWIVYLGDDEGVFSGRERAEAFRRATAAHGHRSGRQVFTGAVTRERVAIDLDRALTNRRRPTALITGNAQTTVRAFQYLGITLAGLDLVAFDDLELAEIVEPPVTVVAQDYVALGRTALELITSRIADPAVRPRHEVTPVHLVDRSGRQGQRAPAQPAHRQRGQG